MPFAYIKYIDGSEVVPTENICKDKQQKGAFDISVYDKNHCYTVKSLKYKDINGKLLKLKGYVCRVAGDENRKQFLNTSFRSSQHFVDTSEWYFFDPQKILPK